MGAPLLKINGFDFSPYLNVQHEDGLDPLNPERIAPDFTGSPAFREGKAAVGQAVDNRNWTIPLVLEAADRSGLHSLVRQANQVLVKGATVEFAVDGTVDPTSYFLLENGRLDGLFQYYLSVHSTTRATLHLWTTPHASSGTQRLVASLPQGSAAAFSFPATALLGDANPLANLEVRVGSAVASMGRVIAWGLHPHPSFNGVHRATSGLAQTGATVRGASGAIGSQYTAIPVSPTSASGISYTAFLTPPEAHVGRHRVLAVGRSQLTAPVTMYAEDRFGAILGPTAQATQVDGSKWQVIDLGEVQVPGRASTQEPVPTQYVNIRAGGAIGASVVATKAFHLNTLIFLPLDYSAGILRTPGQSGTSIYDAYSRFPDMLNGGELLDNRPVSDSGHRWTKVGGYLGVYTRWGAELAAVNSEGDGQTGATGFYDLASGGAVKDVELTMSNAGVGTVNASGAWFEGWAKRQPGLASAGVWTRITMAPSLSAALFLGDGETATRIASAAIASTIGSIIAAGQGFNVALRCIGGNAELYVATGPGQSAAPMLTGGHPGIGLAGNPALRMQSGRATQVTGVNARREGLSIGEFALAAFGAGGSDIGAREWFRFESWPQERVYQGNASVFSADRTADYRGHAPELIPVGSNTASSIPARVVLFQGEIDNVIGNDGPNVALTALERWEYLR